MSPHCKWLPVAWFLSSSSPSLPLHTDRRCRCLKKQYTQGALLPGTEPRHETTLPRQELTTTDLIFPLGIIEKLHVTDVSHFTGCRAGRCSDIHWRRARKGSDGAITLCDAELLLVSSRGALQEEGSVRSLVLRGALGGVINSPRPHRLQCQDQGRARGTHTLGSSLIA